ncbi:MULTISPECIES: DUF2207 domain-containing protein [Methanobacterium]|jgi:hypothetical protein|nr:MULTISPECIES: DUF2207 domain-containing protein [Methanobacterium]MBF4474905.1 hypothetical protein [Methanobacterium formicicum]MDD4811052.1 hypothetical protein [Methanobacterium formicicum]MDH2660652.1 hypothetical protein [Methanobacterium formicicum]
MPSKDDPITKNIEGLCAYITELEVFRPPAPLGINPYSIRTTLYLLSKQSKRYFFVKTNPELHGKTRNLQKPYSKKFSQFNPKEILKLFFSLITVILIVVGLCFSIFVIYLNFSLFNTILGTVIVSIPSFYLYLVWIITKRRKTAGEEYNNDLKILIQEIIDHGAELIYEKNLDPQKFPLKLRHNDYKGLKYDTKGKNNYVGYFTK